MTVLFSKLVRFPRSCCLFSFLQESMAGQREHIKNSGPVRTQLETFYQLLLSATQPTGIEELVQGRPWYIRTADATKPGMGVIWFSEMIEACVWCTEFPLSM
jgi:hypothetical protein